MEQNTVLINQRIAKNLIAYRKNAGLTQAELAEKINYSDKSVSKWESGNGVPDIYILMQLAELYGVTVNDIIGESPVLPMAAKKDPQRGLHILIMLLSSGIVWLVAVCIFVFLQVSPLDGAWWLIFIYAVPVNAIVVLVLGSVWKYKFLNFLSITTLIWTVLLSVYLSFVYIPPSFALKSLWPIFLIGIPLQTLEILWTFFRYSVFKKKKVAAEETQKTDE